MDWKIATLKESKPISSKVKKMIFETPDFPNHLPGQHITIKITTSDGFVAQRDYSLANPSKQKNLVELGVQLIKNGEVSPTLFQLKPGDKIQIRGPIGGQFIWDSKQPTPTIFIAGGSGIVPFISMIRHHINNLKEPKEIILLVSAKIKKDLLYFKELEQFSKIDPQLKIIYTLTKTLPQNWTGYNRRIDKQMLSENLSKFLSQDPTIYIAGSTLFVEDIFNFLLQIGFKPNQIRTERFG